MTTSGRAFGHRNNASGGSRFAPGRAGRALADPCTTAFFHFLRSNSGIFSVLRYINGILTLSDGARGLQ
jgi:hypothetical protein